MSRNWSLSLSSGKNPDLQKNGRVSCPVPPAEFESDIISYVLSENEGNVLQAARMLDVGKTALYDKMKRYAISAKFRKSI